MPERDWQADWDYIQKLQDRIGISPVSIPPSLFVDFGEYWLTRVRELEEENSRLKQDLQDELWYQEDREKAVADMIKQLEDENHRLRAVAEAARKLNEVLNTWASVTKHHPVAGELNKALATLEGVPRSRVETDEAEPSGSKVV